MDIGYIWDETKYQITVKKHNVHFYEVVAAFDDSNGYEVPDPAEHRDRWLWVGRTPWDRVLIIIYSEEELPLYRVITAYDAERRWLDEYYQRGRI
jgi:uncharacterized DUF497 family protein